jgi:hypothetical protein
MEVNADIEWDLGASVCGVDAVDVTTNCNVEGCSMGLGCLTKARISCVVDEYENGGDDQGCSRGLVHPI